MRVLYYGIRSRLCGEIIWMRSGLRLTSKGSTTPLVLGWTMSMPNSISGPTPSGIEHVSQEARSIVGSIQWWSTARRRGLDTAVADARFHSYDLCCCLSWLSYWCFFDLTGVSAEMLSECGCVTCNLSHESDAPQMQPISVCLYNQKAQRSGASKGKLFQFWWCSDKIGYF